MAVEIFEDPVIREDLHLVVRENHGEELTALARPFAALIDAGRGRAAMMAIRDVERTGSIEDVFNEADVSALRKIPGTVSHTILRRKIDIGLARDFSFEQVIKFGHCAISEKHRAGLRVQ